MKLTPVYGTPVAPVTSVIVELSTQEIAEFAVENNGPVGGAKPHIINFLQQLHLAASGSKNGVLPS
jgi:hypothetical protein